MTITTTENPLSQAMPASGVDTVCRILSLDGGGAKGFYTLGVLKELEASLGSPLCNHFDLIFGTSTGGIIAALLALGNGIDNVHELYTEHVTTIMRSHTKRGRSRALARLASEVFGNLSFSDLQTGVGIVATRWESERPMIFKASVAQTHGRKATFAPGFGCSIAEAVRASCSAYPFFDRAFVTTADGDCIELLDGGFCANNPTLYAIADAVKGLGHSPSSLRVVSVGVGNYPEPKRYGKAWFVRRLSIVQLLQKTLDINTTSMEQLRSILFQDIQTVRINDTFSHPAMATDLMEHDLKKLNVLRQKGRDSYAKHEADLRRLLTLAPHSPIRGDD